MHREARFQWRTGHNCSKHKAHESPFSKAGSHLHVPPEHRPWMLTPEGLHEAFMNKDPCKSSTISLYSRLPTRTLYHNRFSRTESHLEERQHAGKHKGSLFDSPSHNTVWTKARQNKSPSSSCTYEQKHVRDRNVVPTHLAILPGHSLQSN